MYIIIYVICNYFSREKINVILYKLKILFVKIVKILKIL